MKRTRTHTPSTLVTYPALRVVIAGGGTGGHLFPGIALAEAFQDKNLETRILFAGTGNRLETTVLAKTPFAHVAISAGGLKGMGWAGRLKAFAKVFMGFFESIRLLRQFRPDLVVGVGGYVSGPLVLAALVKRIRTVLHEQNVIPGMANRILAPFVDRIYVSFADSRPFFSLRKTQVSGNPIRKDLARMAEELNLVEKKAAADRKKPFTVLVFGGSQGAQQINRAVLEAFAYVTETENLFFIHQTGAADELCVKNAYAASAMAGRVQSFFTDMARQYAQADLVICRAGATTIAELSAIGKAIIFIPYPFAADDHQARNARTMVEKGASEMILERDLTGRRLAERIEYYRRNSARLKAMAQRSRTFGRPEAAAQIVADCYRLLAA
ncbi:MAG: undecaprenyldiphospho-muramoylpentapeptide beta-N-acetylglucosaminyltransferase [Deltaproteobacteria bacterium]|nr:undecaprenyldiphospho-muramoylpentapeptide beta-N-acetylglucosaminyltransferase [Deltaproteobacteria bacterium]